MSIRSINAIILLSCAIGVMLGFYNKNPLLIFIHPLILGNFVIAEIYYKHRYFSIKSIHNKKIYILYQLFFSISCLLYPKSKTNNKIWVKIHNHFDKRNHSKEIERKYLISQTKITSILKNQIGETIVQGYIAHTDQYAIRVRKSNFKNTNKAFLTIKEATADFERDEFEYAIPFENGEAMIAKLPENQLISKTRYKIPFEGNIWEIDIFHGLNEGLYIAEIELDSKTQTFTLPEWVLKDVTEEKRYYNASLAINPFTNW